MPELLCASFATVLLALPLSTKDEVILLHGRVLALSLGRPLLMVMSRKCFPIGTRPRHGTYDSHRISTNVLPPRHWPAYIERPLKHCEVVGASLGRPRLP